MERPEVDGQYLPPLFSLPKLEVCTLGWYSQSRWLVGLWDSFLNDSRRQGFQTEHHAQDFVDENHVNFVSSCFSGSVLPTECPL